jgi:palmitoyl-protein thioesterase
LWGAWKCILIKFPNMKLVTLAIQLSTVLATTPVVLWHGLGDRYDSPGMTGVADQIRDIYPDIYVHSVGLSEDGGKDQQMGLLGNVREQVESVCDQLAAIPELKGGFNAIGFSQGGLFLRSYAELCPLTNASAPVLRKLITFGSPHNGIADMPLCGPSDFLCKSRNKLFKSQVWTRNSQTNVVVAQYYRDPNHMDVYLEKSGFLADINNERQQKNKTYDLSYLEKFVMVMFSEDTTVVPMESAWFQEVDLKSGQVTHLEDREIYQEDWIGLKKLGKRGDLEFHTVHGQHMEINDDVIETFALRYLGDDDDIKAGDDFVFVNQAK